MTSRPRVSYGCDVCRRRKIKCDEARPRCGFCTRLDYNCSYRDVFEVVHRNQTVIAGQRAQQRWRKRTIGQIGKTRPFSQQRRAGVDDSESRAGGSLLDRQSQIQRCVEIPRSPPLADWRELAFMRLRYDFLDPPDAFVKPSGTLEMVPQLWASLPSRSLLVTTVTAVAFANYAARTRGIQFFNIARDYYVRAVRDLRVITMSTPRPVDDHVLIASHILSLYEILSKPIIDLSFSAHLGGSESMLERFTHDKTDVRRAQDFVNSGIGLRLLKHALLRHMAFKQSLPQWLKQMIESIPKERIEPDMMRMSCDIVELCARMNEAMFQIGSDQHLTFSPNALLTRARELDAEFRAWRNLLPIETYHQSFDLRADERKVLWVRQLFSRRGSPSIMDVPRSSARAHEYNMYPTMMLNLQCCMLDMVRTLESHGWTSEEAQLEGEHGYTDQQESSREPPCDDDRVHLFMKADSDAAIGTILDVARNLLRSVPHLCRVQPPSSATVSGADIAPETIRGLPDPTSPLELTGLRGYSIFWPLVNVLKCFTRPEMKPYEYLGIDDWIKNFLQFLWLELGIAQAEGYRRWYEDGLPPEF